MSAGPDFGKASWTIPLGAVGSVRGHAHPDNVSAYVTDALRRQLELDDLAALVAEMEATIGPFDPEVVTRYAAEMR